MTQISLLGVGTAANIEEEEVEEKEEEEEEMEGVASSDQTEHMPCLLLAPASQSLAKPVQQTI